MQRECPGGLDRDLDPMVDERASFHERAFAGRSSTARSRGTCRQAGAGQSQPRHRRRPERNAHLVHLVLVRVVVRRVQPLRPDPPVEQLHRNGVAIRSRERERPVALPLPRDTIPARADQHIAPEQRDVGDHDAPAGTGRGIPDHERGRRRRRAAARRIGIVVHEIVHTAPHHLPRQRLDAREARLDRARDVVGRAARDGIMELAAHQRTPRELEHRPAVAPSRAPRQRRERLGHARERQLGRGIPSFERRPRPMHALEGPRVAIGPAQLTREGRRLRTVRGGLKEFVES